MGLSVTTHGFRSSFRDWCGDCTHYPQEVAEAALAHTIRDRTESAYRRGKALDKRRELMAARAKYCEPKADNVDCDEEKQTNSRLERDNGATA